MRMVEEARRAQELFDPTELTRLVEEARRAQELFNPTELRRLAEEARRAQELFGPDGADAAGRGGPPCAGTVRTRRS